MKLKRISFKIKLMIYQKQKQKKNYTENKYKNAKRKYKQINQRLSRK